MTVPSVALYNTLAREKQPFEPLDAKNVRMYVCGPTVYDYAHIGNARPVVVFDVLYRLLRHVYGAGHVTYVRNITDVDDKIISAHEETGQPIAEITRRTAEAYHADMTALGALDPDREPRATQHIAQMITMIRTLITGGFAYEAEGHVLFEVATWSDYGGLSRHKREDINAGARVEVAPYKKDPADFVLWKPSPPELPGWDSPWGRGRPGWHIECSAMSTQYLGETFDIHGGGQDLIFPHHENEIAQSVCAHGGRPFARYWVHNGYLMVEGDKMSKSLGNFYTVHDLLKEFPGEAIRLVLLKTHYRQPQDFTKAGIAEAKNELDGFYGALRRARDVGASQPTGSDVLLEGFVKALCDDLNTPQALLHLHGRMRQLNLSLRDNSRDGENARKYDKWVLLEMGQMLGLLGQDPEDWFRWGAEDLAEMQVHAIKVEIQKRTAARKNRDFAEADRIRDFLKSRGIVLEDGPDGTIWRRA